MGVTVHRRRRQLLTVAVKEEISTVWTWGSNFNNGSW